MLVIPRTAVLSRIWTSEAFFAFCCAEAANKARHSNAMVETLMRLSVSGAFPYVGRMMGVGYTALRYNRGSGRCTGNHGLATAQVQGGGHEVDRRGRHRRLGGLSNRPSGRWRRDPGYRRSAEDAVGGEGQEKSGGDRSGY